MQGNLSLFFTAMILSDLHEGPLLSYPNAILRITQLPSFRQDAYVARISSDGQALFKHGVSSQEPQSPGRDVLLAQSDYSLASLNQFLYTVPDTSHVTSQTAALQPGVFAKIQRSYHDISAEYRLDPPEVLQLDGSSVFLELAAPSKGLLLSVGHDYPPPFSDLLAITEIVEDAAAEVIPAVFDKLKSPLAALDPEDLDRLLRAELPSVISLIFAFVPTPNLQQYVARYRPTEAAGIIAASRNIDRRDSQSVSLFYEIERVIARKLQN